MEQNNKKYVLICNAAGMEGMFYGGPVENGFWTSDIKKAEILNEKEKDYWLSVLMADAVEYKDAITN